MSSVSGYSSASGFSSGSLNISASGLRDAQARMDAVANNVANANTPGFEADRIDAKADVSGGVTPEVAPKEQLEALDMASRDKLLSNTDLPTELVNMIQAKAAYQANASAIERNQDTWRELMKAV
ncbi:MAG: flagellar basal body protein [Vampirovibrionales bacterium]|nr:flagellar basal body protein [Vampirovibrionales bacterium]